MYLKHKTTGKAVEVLGLTDLFDPLHAQIVGRFHAGEEMQDPEKFDKADLAFCSGEGMPRCWLDAHYRDESLRR